MKWKEEEDYENNKDEIERKNWERKEFLAEKKWELKQHFKHTKIEREKLWQAEEDYMKKKHELH